MMSLALLLLAAATPFADPVQIDRDVALFTGAQIGLPGGALAPVDRRLRLNACAAPLALSWQSTRQDNVLVQCPDAGGWRLYVPVRSAGDTAQIAVRRGDAVTISVQGEGFAVTQPGEALEQGGEGDWIRVRPAGRSPSAGGGDTMRARIIRPGLVSLPLD